MIEDRSARVGRRRLLMGLAAAAAASPLAAQPWPVREGFPVSNFDEAKVRSYRLPDPLVLQNGQRVRDAATWTARRRPEILRLFEENQHGRTPRTRLPARHQVVDTGTPALDGTALRTQVRIRFSDAPDTPVIRVLLHTPAKAKGPVPTLLHLGFSPPFSQVDEPGVDEGMAWNITTKARVPDRQVRSRRELDVRRFVDKGFGVAYVYCNDIDPDFHGGAPFGVRALFGPQAEPRRPDEWGCVGAWAWGLSRVLDWLRTVPAVDGGKVAVSGMSRMGKAAIWAGAQDERFAAVIPMVSGEGGAAISRRNFGETVADLMDPKRYPYWFAPRYDTFSARIDELPVDGHMLVALVAPRPILLITGSTDIWSDPKGEFLSAVAAGPVYRLLGKRDMGLTEYPAPETRIVSDLSYYVHDGGHMIAPGDLDAMLAFLNHHLGKPAAA